MGTLKEEFFRLLTEQGVYSSIKCTTAIEGYKMFKTYPHTLDMFCPNCKTDKTLVFSTRIYNTALGTFAVNGGNGYEERIQGVAYSCPTCQNSFAFLFFIADDEIIKIGQYPSLYNISRDEFKKYQKNTLIGKEEFDEFHKAEICASESYYIAAYTYMRRIYETMLISVFEQNKSEIGMERAEFNKLHSDQKVKKLKSYLGIEDEIYNPLYKLLSEGIHLLSEEECAESYQLLKAILLDILEAQKTKTEKTKKRKEILELYSQHKNNSQEENN